MVSNVLIAWRLQHTVVILIFMKYEYNFIIQNIPRFGKWA